MQYPLGTGTAIASRETGGLFRASDEPGEKTADLSGERRAGLWQLGDEIAVLLALKGEQTSEFVHLFSEVIDLGLLQLDSFIRRVHIMEILSRRLSRRSV